MLRKTCREKKKDFPIFLHYVGFIDPRVLKRQADETPGRGEGVWTIQKIH